MRKKAVFNWSGGKDSALALYKILQDDDFEIISLLTTVNSASNRSSMHAIPHELLKMQAESIGIPLYEVPLSPEGEMAGYEEAMNKAINHFKSLGVTHFVFGDIFLHDVRSYRENQLNPRGIEIVEPLWDISEPQIIDDFIDSGLKSVIVTTMANLLDESYIGKIIDRDFIDNLPKEVDICGENGEYHSFCFDGPIFRFPIRFSLDDKVFVTNDVKMADGTTETFTYWYSSLSPEK